MSSLKSSHLKVVGAQACYLTEEEKLILKLFDLGFALKATREDGVLEFFRFRSTSNIENAPKINEIAEMSNGREKLKAIDTLINYYEVKNNERFGFEYSAFGERLIHAIDFVGEGCFYVTDKDVAYIHRDEKVSHYSVAEFLQASMNDIFGLKDSTREKVPQKEGVVANSGSGAAGNDIA